MRVTSVRNFMTATPIRPLFKGNGQKISNYEYKNTNNQYLQQDKFEKTKK